MGEGVLVVGELNVDLVLSGMEGVPAPGREVLAREMGMVLGGSSAICAAGLARLGARVDLLGKVGADGFGEFLMEELERLGVGRRHMIRDRATQTGVTVSLTTPRDRALVTYLGSIAELSVAEIPLSVLGGYRHLHVGSYFLQAGLQRGLPALFDAAHRAGLTVSLDTGWDPWEQWGGEALLALLERVDVFLPNEEEARAIAGRDEVEAAMRELGERAGLVVVKRGAEGCVALVAGRVVASRGFGVQAVDTTGAGDSFDAGLLYAYVLERRPPAEALRFANACGALSTRGYGGTGSQATAEEARGMMG